MSRIFLDVETTGLSPGDGHRIIEIAAIAYAGHAAGGGGERGKFHRLLDPERDVPDEAVEIHGITYSKLDGKEKFADIAQELAAYLKDCEASSPTTPLSTSPSSTWSFAASGCRRSRRSSPRSPTRLR